MEVYKICKAEYASALKASGIENRWNRKNQFVVYTGSSRSLCALELIAHRSGIMPQKSYKSMIISFGDSPDLVKEIGFKELPKNWFKLESYPKLQEIGSRWYTGNESLVLKVPSAIIQKEFNYVINTEHPLFASEIKLMQSEDFFWDERIL